jgi:hypothetical protein
MEKMFERATREKMRFSFKGQISVEDLWDLSVEDLDSIFKTLNRQAKQVKEESLLQVKTKQDEEVDLKIEIVKYIVKVKLEEQEQKQKEKERKQQRQKILEILSMKENESLQNKSIDELKAMLNELE